ncbi:uncharacterized protein LOC114322342 [Camellia sinensis]|uniref:uncharacterized protein LOC114322342 n=1 Tax=Camellia sinensis TaxID=4442 RepID=UPI00103662C3|nr:uncharacterized protein LOC114322342 [Camellia sinensis]
MTSTLLQASIKYTGQALELTALVMGMLQRSMHLLSIYDNPIPATASASTGPSVPISRGAGKAGRGTPAQSRSRAGRTQIGSSSRAPVPDDDESDEEALSPQSESS